MLCHVCAGRPYGPLDSQDCRQRGCRGQSAGTQKENPRETLEEAPGRVSCGDGCRALDRSADGSLFPLRPPGMRRLCPGVQRRIRRGLRPGSDRLLRRILRPTRRLVFRVLCARMPDSMSNGLSDCLSDGLPHRMSNSLSHGMPNSLPHNLSLFRLLTDGRAYWGTKKKITVRAALDEDRLRTVSPPGNVLGSNDDSQKCSRCPVVFPSQMRRKIDRPIGPPDFGNTCRLIRFCR